jgi:hypothetical protein
MKLFVFSDKGLKKGKILIKDSKFSFDKLLDKVTAALRSKIPFRAIAYFDGSSVEHVYDNLLFVEFLHVLDVYQQLGMETMPIYVEEKADANFDKQDFLRSLLSEEQIEKLRSAVDETFNTIKSDTKLFVDSEVFDQSLCLAHKPFGGRGQNLEKKLVESEVTECCYLNLNSHQNNSQNILNSEFELPGECDTSLIIEKLPLSIECLCGYIVIAGEEYYTCVLCPHFSCIDCRKTNPHDHEMALTEMSQVEDIAIFESNAMTCHFESGQSELAETNRGSNLSQSVVQLISSVFANPFSRYKKGIQHKVAC